MPEAFAPPQQAGTGISKPYLDLAPDLGHKIYRIRSVFEPKESPQEEQRDTGSSIQGLQKRFSAQDTRRHSAGTSSQTRFETKRVGS
jgi:hypothetical protein